MNAHLPAMFSKSFWAIVLAAYLLISVITYSVIRTVMPASIPLKDVSVTTVTTRKQDVIEVDYTINFTSTASWSGVVFREAIGISNPEYQYEFSGFYRNYDSGPGSKSRTLLMPASTPPGRYRLRTFIIWHPLLSAREHISEMPESTFLVCRNLGKCVSSVDLKK